MSPASVEFNPRAIEDARKAHRWYARRSVAAANRFLIELDNALTQIAAAPAQWSPHLHGTRSYPLHRFPYHIVYRELPGTVRVVAVAHTRRRPGYWRRRLP